MPASSSIVVNNGRTLFYIGVSLALISIGVLFLRPCPVVPAEPSTRTTVVVSFSPGASGVLTTPDIAHFCNYTYAVDTSQKYAARLPDNADVPLSCLRDHLHDREESVCRRSEKKGVIYSLIGSEDEHVHESLRMLESVNKYYPFPADVMIFHYGLSDELKLRLNSTIKSREFTFVDVSRYFESYSPESRMPRTSFNGCEKYPVTYLQMSHFLAQRIFQVPELQSYEYGWRIDSDAVLTGPTKEDVFEWMSKRDAVWSVALTGDDSCQLSFSEALDTYLRNPSYSCGRPIRRFDQFLYPEHSASKGRRWVVYNCNTDIIRFSFFAHPHYQKYMKFMEQSGGLYNHRWGEHMLKGSYVGLFAAEHQFECLSGIIQYHHPGGQHCVPRN
eukprot:ANDGO_05993.mRNA.1 putative mannosyltransferase KTR4